jgi:hypothetical protein
MGVGGGQRRPRRCRLQHGHRRRGGLERLDAAADAPEVHAAAARSAAAVACSSTAAAMPASSAWWASRAGSSRDVTTRWPGSGVQLDAPAGGDGPLHRQAGQLVAEAEAATLAAEHPGGNALVHGRRVGPGDRLQERRLDAIGHDRGGVERAPRHRREPAGPGEHGVADGRRHLPAGGAEHLGDEEEVAAGGLVQAVGVDPPAGGPGRPRPPWSAPGARGGAPSARSPGRR